MNPENESRDNIPVIEKRQDRVEDEMKRFPKEDKRKVAQQEHTNHFTSRGDNRAKTQKI